VVDTAGERTSWSLDWDQSMATILPELELACTNAAMTPAQQDHFHQLQAELRDALPLIEQLDLFPPRIAPQ
jgi:hypothetical protein